MAEGTGGRPGVPGKALTMEEFAAAAGVSRPTASKYFHDPGSVRPASRERIRRAAEALDYRPNLFATNFNRRQTRTIGVVVPSMTDPFYAEVVRHLELGALGAGYWPIVLNAHADPELEMRALQALASMKAAGMLIAPLGAGGPPRRGGPGVPTVWLDAGGDGGPFVGTDNVQSFGLIVDHLCRTGEAPCFLAMPEVNGNARGRRDAYAAAMRRLGREPAVVEPARGGWDFEQAGLETAERALDAGGFPSRTVLCANDRLAFGVLAAAARRGLRVGRGAGFDLRVAGHDDHPLSRFACPALTTVAQDYAGIARAALAMLIARIGSGAADAEGTTRLFEGRLAVRDSA